MTNQEFNAKFAEDVKKQMEESELCGGKPELMRKKITSARGGAYAVAVESMKSGVIHQGCLRMVKMGREDLTLEYLVLRYKDTGLFDQETLDGAQRRLAQAHKKITEQKMPATK